MGFRDALVALTLLFAFTAACAQRPDFTGATILESGTCTVQGDDLPCTVFEKDGVKYLVFWDDQMEMVLVFRARSELSSTIYQGDLVLIWSKKDEVKMLT